DHTARQRDHKGDAHARTDESEQHRMVDEKVHYAHLTKSAPNGFGAPRPVSQAREPIRSDGRAAERRRADVLRLRTDPGDRREKKVTEPGVVLLEDTDDLRCGHGRTSLDADVVVRDHRDRRVTELEL